MTKRTYKILDKEFKTKQAIITYIRSVAKRYRHNEALSDDDFTFMYEVLKLHPSADEKIGCGVKSIRKIISSYGNNAFEIVRGDGTTTDFSFYHCISPKNEKHDFYMACREAVYPYISEFKKNQFRNKTNYDGTITCPLTLEKCTIETAHVDHEPHNTFKDIVDKWLKSRKLTVEDIEIIGFEDGSETKHFKDNLLESDFVSYHNKYAKLRITSASGNLSVAKQQGDKSITFV